MLIPQIPNNTSENKIAASFPKVSLVSLENQSFNVKLTPLRNPNPYKAPLAADIDNQVTQEMILKKLEIQRYLGLATMLGSLSVPLTTNQLIGVVIRYTPQFEYFVRATSQIGSVAMLAIGLTVGLRAAVKEEKLKTENKIRPK